MSVDTQNKILLALGIIWTIAFVISVGSIAYIAMVMHHVGMRLL
jgi:hypothetical protein